MSVVASALRTGTSARRRCWLGGGWLNGSLEFPDGCVKRYREGTFAADEIGPLEFYSEAVTLLGNFERIRGESNDVFASIYV